MYEKYPSVASHTHRTRDGTQNPGMCPITNPTGDLLVHGTTLKPTEPPGQDLQSVLVLSRLWGHFSNSITLDVSFPQNSPRKVDTTNSSGCRCR